MLADAANGFLQEVSGVIHVGANIGQERNLYEERGLAVVWIEPIPEVFTALEANLHAFPRQRAFQCLVTDRDDIEYQFHISNNAGRSSSILDLKLHRDIWPRVTFARTITLRSMTLASLLRLKEVDLRYYDALVMDTQGSELLVLQGALPILHHFSYIKTEAADFECYAGCCELADIELFMGRNGYREVSRLLFAQRAGGGNCYDIVYKKVDPGSSIG